MFTVKSQVLRESSEQGANAKSLLVSSPHPRSGVRLFRRRCADDEYGRFLEETSLKHHEFWLRNKERYSHFNFDSENAFREYILKNSHEFAEYNRFVWKSNFGGLWIYLKTRLLKL